MRRIIAVVINFIFAFIIYKIYSSVTDWKFLIAYFGGAIGLGINLLIINRRL